MKRRTHPSAPVPINPDLEAQWGEAFATHPGSEDAAKLAAWNKEHGELIETYSQAVAQEKAAQVDTTKRRWRSRFKWAASLTVIALVGGGGIYWANQPSTEEARLAEIQRQEEACDVRYEQTHGFTLVTRQIDLLDEGEGG